MSNKIPPLAPAINWYEKALKDCQNTDDPDNTLLVQLTRYELLLVAFGLMWVNRMYGLSAAGPFLKKLEELIRAQDFYSPHGADGIGEV